MQSDYFYSSIGSRYALNPVRQLALSAMFAVTVLLAAAAQADLPSGAVSWWHADGNALDSVDSNNGTLLNGATYGPGKFGQAFSFNGGTAVVNVPNAPSLNPTSGLTLAGWFYMTAFSSNDGMVLWAKDNSSSLRQYQLGIYNNGGHWNLNANIGVPSGFKQFFGNTAISLDTWYHAVMTYDGSALNLYLNGQFDGTMAVSGPITVADVPFTIGGLGSGPWTFNGRADDVLMFNRALTASEVNSLYLIPEPGTGALLGIFGCLALFRRRLPHNSAAC